MINPVLIYIIMYFCFMCYANYEGEREAYYYFYESKMSGIKRNLHSIFWSQRLLVVILACATMPTEIRIPTILSFALIFSYIHNGVYFETRNYLTPDIYKLKWKDASENAKFLASLSFKDRIRTMWGMYKNNNNYAAIFDFTYKSRLIQFIIGVCIFSGVLTYLILK